MSYTVNINTSPNNISSVYVSEQTVESGETITLYARPFPNYIFVKWSDGDTSNPRQLTVTANITLVAEYQRFVETNEVYQNRCYVKDQLHLTDAQKHSWLSIRLMLKETW